MSTAFLAFWSRSLKPSHRSFAEQSVGLVIFFLITLGLQCLNSWIAVGREMLDPLFFPMNYSSSWTFFYLSQLLSIWMLWRRFSLHVLKLECSLFLSQFALATLWSFSFFHWQQMLLALVVLLLQMMATLLSTIVFWKKERIAGQWMLVGMVWSLYVGALNMAICLLN